MTSPTAADESSSTTAADESSSTTAADESPSTTAADDSSPTTAADDSSPTTAADESSPTTAADESSSTTAADESSSTTAADESSSTTAADESSSTTAADDPNRGLDARGATPPPSHLHPHPYAHPHAHHHLDAREARSVGGLLAVGLVVGYEVGATALNAVLEEDVLPTLQSLIQNTSLKGVEVKGAQVLGQIAMWAGLVTTAVVLEIGLRRRLSRRSRR